jgi:aspartate/glutamate racemase
MKTIGLTGGMSWESSDLYYQILNRKILNMAVSFYPGELVSP